MANVITTAYGKVTERFSDFGYGSVFVANGEINYWDSSTYKTWKTVTGFERWAAKQNEICGNIFDEIKTNF